MVETTQVLQRNLLQGYYYNYNYLKPLINRYGVMFSLISQNGLALERTFRYCIVIEVLI